MEEIILYFACKYYGDWDRIYDALEKQEDVDFNKIKEVKEKYKDKYTTIISGDYPENLKYIDRPPFVLFYTGKKELLKNKSKI